MLPQRRRSLAILSPPDRNSEQERAVSYQAQPEQPPARLIRLNVVICLMLTCLGAFWFADQWLLVPQPTLFTPDWQGAHWIQATDGGGSLAYFRRVVSLNPVPDSAFISVAADQMFRLYVNGVFVSSNTADFAQDNRQHAAIYDITSRLRPGSNVLAIRVTNGDGRSPAVRASFGLAHGRGIDYSGTDGTWQATTQASLAYTHNTLDALAWTARNFNASFWPTSRVTGPPALTPMLQVHPLLYEKPLATQWMSAGAGHEAYFVRTLILPAGETHIWLRLVADGVANVYLNGNLWIIWNGAPPVEQHQKASPLRPIHNTIHNRNTIRQSDGLAMGIYDISPYLHTGTNTLAIHVLSPGKSATLAGLETVGAALALDLLASDEQGHALWLMPDNGNSGWHAARQSVEGWTHDAALNWPAPLSIGRPGASAVIYVTDQASSTRNIATFPLMPPLLLALACIGIVCVHWLLMALLLRKLYPERADLGQLALTYLPALAGEIFLLALRQVSTIAPPFPYTWPCAGLLLTLLAGGFGLLLMTLHIQRAALARKIVEGTATVIEPDGASPSTALYAAARQATISPLAAEETIVERRTYRMSAQLALLRLHWGLILLVLIALPLISYNLAYEPYWQDELTSYFAAKGILAHGLPLLPSGFLYPKGELYSYLLALSMALLGEQNGLLRVVSVLGYLISLPLMYIAGCYFFDRKIALLATAMLAFSPLTLLWGRAVRMYELAQLLTILVMYLFFKALQQRDRPHLIYLAIFSLIATYLSHEEVFIILPALVLCVLIVSYDGTQRWPAVLYQKHWWIATAVGASIISCQLIIAKFSHPPILGSDQSQQPLIQLITDNIPYYVKLFFCPQALGDAQAMITVNSWLALAGCLWALCSRSLQARYCAVFFLASLLMLVLGFTPTASRYIYPLLPSFYLLGAYALLSGLRRLLSLAQQSGASVRRVGGEILMQPLRWLTVATTLLVSVSVLLLPAFPSSNYNLLVSRLAGLTYHRHFPDYDASGQYVRQHWRQGDIIVSISPAISVLYYAGRVDAFFSVDRALYLFEHDGQITDTPTGSMPLLSQGDLNALLARHARIWVVTDKGLFRSGPMKGGRFVFPPDFHLVYAGSGSSIYLRGDNL